MQAGRPLYWPEWSEQDFFLMTYKGFYWKLAVNSRQWMVTDHKAYGELRWAKKNKILASSVLKYISMGIYRVMISK